MAFEHACPTYRMAGALYFLSHVFDKGFARHSAGRRGADPYGGIGSAFGWHGSEMLREGRAPPLQETLQ